MRKVYDFSKARPNPYSARLKKPVTIRLDQPTIAYFKELAADTGLPYQTMINLYLRDCASTGRKLNLQWTPTVKAYVRKHGGGSKVGSR